MKYQFFLLVTFVLLYSPCYLTDKVCPNKDLIKPCTCEQGLDNLSIRCDGNQELDLSKLFETLNKSFNETEKHLETFHLSNSVIKELKANTFKGITFEEIFIGYCHNLTSIDENAFNGTNLMTSYLLFYNNSKLSSPNNLLFKIASSFPKLHFFELEFLNITEIPTNAFKQLNDLVELSFAGNSLQKLGAGAFGKLSNIVSVTFEQVNFTTIPDNAFEFESPSNDTVTIDFSRNPLLTNSIFSEKSLLNIKRPAIVRFGSGLLPTTAAKQMTYLNEKLFSPFLLENDKNSIHLSGVPFDCNDCRNYWLKKNPKALAKVLFLTCSNKKKFEDSENFKNCSTY